MIEVKKVADYYEVSFAGKRHQFTDYINKIMSIEEKEYNFEHKTWMFRETGMQEVRRLFKPKEKPSVIPAAVTHKVTDFDSMGVNMKLQPYDYQKEAMKYILDNKEALLVLPCGAGKTPTMVGAYLELKERGLITGTGLIVVKASLKYQWHKEVSKFTDLRSKVILSPKEAAAKTNDKIKRRKAAMKRAEKAGDKTKVKELQKEEIALRKQAILDFESQFKDADLFILNYETLREQEVRSALRKAKVEAVFADEIHYAKNKDSKRSKALAEFADVPYKVGATATPVGKNPEDLYGIFRFVAPATFPKWSHFSSMYIQWGGYGKIIGFKNLDKLRTKIAPNLFVKSKEDVAKQLPSLVVIPRFCELTAAQQEVSAGIMAKLDDLKEQEKAIRAGFKSEKDALHNPDLMKVEALILAHQTFAQQLANTEELFKLSESEMAKEFITGSSSNKMELLAELVEEILSSGEKVAIYSRYAKMQPIMTKMFNKLFPDVKIARIYGALSAEERYEEAYTKFRDTDDYKILLSSDAGAEGLNLSMCKYLIEIEPAESYGIQTQRWGRLERADSIHDTVFVYQLICNDSWDEVALKIVSKKEGYDIELIRPSSDE